MGIYEAEDKLANGDRFETDTANMLKHFLAMRQRAMEKLHSNEITNARN
jgi:hypothetical protein